VDKEAIVLPSGSYHSLQLYYSCLLRLEIITSTVQTDIGEGPEDRKIKPIHQAAKKSQHKTHPTLAFGA
jgi:hypothetical protein